LQAIMHLHNPVCLYFDIWDPHMIYQTAFQVFLLLLHMSFLVTSFQHQFCQVASRQICLLVGCSGVYFFNPLLKCRHIRKPTPGADKHIAVFVHIEIGFSVFAAYPIHGDIAAIFSLRRFRNCTPRQRCTARKRCTAHQSCTARQRCTAHQSLLLRYNPQQGISCDHTHLLQSCQNPLTCTFSLLFPSPYSSLQQFTISLLTP
jgi:hypothetical protein